MRRSWAGSATNWIRAAQDDFVEPAELLRTSSGVGGRVQIVSWCQLSLRDMKVKWQQLVYLEELWCLSNHANL